MTFEIDRGEIFGLLGHNGARKTTSIECILGTKSIIYGQWNRRGAGNGSKKGAKKLFEKVGVPISANELSGYHGCNRNHLYHNFNKVF